jgi:DNA-binding transcriptional regulator YiaG
MRNNDAERPLLKPRELQAILDKLGIGQEHFAKVLHASRRTGQNWVHQSVPGSVALIALLLNERPEMLAVFRRLANVPRPDALERTGRPTKVEAL